MGSTSDFTMPNMSGASLFTNIKEQYPDVAVVFITGVNDVKSAVEQLKNGAYDYIVKPVTIQQLGQVIEEAPTQRKTVLTENRFLEGHNSGGKTFDSIASVTDAERLRAHRAASTDGAVSIMFTDLEGYTQQLNRLGEEENQALLRIHNCVIREEVSRHAGIEVKSMGDGFMIVFPSPTEAAACAVAIQGRLSKFNVENADRHLKIRIGINVGKTIHEEEDFFGRAVVLAARIMSEASGGQILTSERLRSLESTTSPWQYVDFGWRKLKGFSEEEHLYLIEWQRSQPRELSPADPT